MPEVERPIMLIGGRSHGQVFVPTREGLNRIAVPVRSPQVLFPDDLATPKQTGEIYYRRRFWLEKAITEFMVWEGCGDKDAERLAQAAIVWAKSVLIERE